jgi:hypothetical protein
LARILSCCRVATYFIDVGCPQAVTQARELFGSTMAEQVVMTLDDTTG